MLSGSMALGRSILSAEPRIESWISAGSTVDSVFRVQGWYRGMGISTLNPKPLDSKPLNPEAAATRPAKARSLVQSLIPKSQTLRTKTDNTTKLRTATAKLKQQTKFQSHIALSSNELKPKTQTPDPVNLFIEKPVTA